MNGTTLARIGLLYLALTSTLVGAWAQFAPGSFYEAFPLGRGWVAVDGPFNEHLVRDVGGLNLALAVVAFVAARWPSLALVRATAVATLVYQIPHAVYHAAHQAPLPTDTDRVLNAGSLMTSVLVALLLLMFRARSSEPKRDQS